MQELSSFSIYYRKLNAIWVYKNDLKIILKAFKLF